MYCGYHTDSIRYIRNTIRHMPEESKFTPIMSNTHRHTHTYIAMCNFT